jgi:membrane protein implicated in regulation of membrane protease activity
MIFPIAVHSFPNPTVGVVVEDIAQADRGRVKYEAIYWPAELVEPSSNTSLPTGSRVLVVGRKGITLLVRPT